MVRITIKFIGFIFIFFGCSEAKENTEKKNTNQQPNIIYILAEDPSWPFFAEVK